MLRDIADRHCLVWAAIAMIIGICYPATAVATRGSRDTFAHPAGWHTAADIAQIRAHVASGLEPWHAAYGPRRPVPIAHLRMLLACNGCSSARGRLVCSRRRQIGPCAI